MQYNLALAEKNFENTWNFATANTKEYTHCYHNYPAMMIPQIANRLLKDYGDGAKILFDPYCGTGTSLVEARLSGINSIGTDLNPLAQLLSRAKTSIYNLEEIKRTTSKLFIKLNEKPNLKTTVPKLKNIDYWFSPETQKQIATLKEIIENTCPKEMLDFFLVPFSETIRESSYTRKSEFKLYRIEQEKIKSHNVNPFNLYLNKLNRNLKGYISFHRLANKQVYSQIYGFNTCHGIPDTIFKNHVDLIVTSPPYGDSSTTVAYGQFSRLSNQWLGANNAHQIDQLLMGGKRKISHIDIEIKSAKNELSKIKSIDFKRYQEVNNFLMDYWQSIKNISPLVRKGGHVCYVVGNRTVKNVKIPLDKITVEFFVQHGYKHVGSFDRRIPNKRMPYKNSPTNITGQLSETMTKEHIIVLKKL